MKFRYGFFGFAAVGLSCLACLASMLACGSGGNPVEPLAPPASVVLAVFTDTDGFATTDVLDVDDEIVRFDTSQDTMLWSDNTAFEGFPVNDVFIRQDRFFQVRFGTENGVKKAYFTETTAGTICDVFIQNGTIQIQSTSSLPPSS